MRLASPWSDAETTTPAWSWMNQRTGTCLRSHRIRRSSIESAVCTRRSSVRSEASNASSVSAQRSALMARVRRRNTAPELVVRSILHRLGLRFTVGGRLNRSLPSRPDVVLPRWKTVVLVHGCFWHRHAGCAATTTPKTRRAFWTTKFEANVARDKLQRRQLRMLGWRVVTVWECETRLPTKLRRRLQKLFVPAPKNRETNMSSRRGSPPHHQPMPRPGGVPGRT